MGGSSLHSDFIQFSFIPHFLLNACSIHLLGGHASAGRRGSSRADWSKCPQPMCPGPPLPFCFADPHTLERGRAMESPVLQIATDPQFPVEETEGQSRTPGIMALSLGLSPRDPETRQGRHGGSWNSPAGVLNGQLTTDISAVLVSSPCLCSRGCPCWNASSFHLSESFHPSRKAQRKALFTSEVWG